MPCNKIMCRKNPDPNQFGIFFLVLSRTKWGLVEKRTLNNEIVKFVAIGRR